MEGGISVIPSVQFPTPIVVDSTRPEREIALTAGIGIPRLRQDAVRLEKAEGKRWARRRENCEITIHPIIAF